MRIRIHAENLVGECLSDRFDIPEIKHHRLETINASQESLRL
ncbi:MAG TPA: hypothetical protein VGZ01_11445 [Trinickia sp.]|jgi:hypothetical protein|nr:hypothetical protein [Trinickia sp.]